MVERLGSLVAFLSDDFGGMGECVASSGVDLVFDMVASLFGGIAGVGEGGSSVVGAGFEAVECVELGLGGLPDTFEGLVAGVLGGLACGFERVGGVLDLL